MKKIPTDTWILVADGAEARLFRNAGTDYRLSLEQIELIQPRDLLDEGPSGHRPPESDEQSTDEATFAKQLANRLNAAALQNTYAHLVLVADPQTLGQMRPQLHKETQRRLLMEVAKTFTNAPLADIQSALQAE
ncbi:MULTISPECIES: host attachment family protein [Oleiagrimonas]|uniref:Host attachment protein n=1 Tax=Oleiagrimonas citrea TaxID=1665687 RepID=A0A846ZLU0_9GAMM|nr:MULTISPECIES: host attachment family protein [Oleiagrimonas]NKZ38413.1 host attachment protein [Oleiagrimonas citrea]RAP58329.1 attachment protein [Oleiagrimonas sp. MCCC 1A03011]